MQADCPVALSPLDENRRLAALRALEILDSEPETDFDALTRLAAHALGTPIAVIGLMDSDRLWFKSRVGLAAPELDRQIAFCSHTITQPGRPLIVPDLLADARFTDHPLVAAGPRLRFYAGAPLVEGVGEQWNQKPRFCRTLSRNGSVR